MAKVTQEIRLHQSCGLFVGEPPSVRIVAGDRQVLEMVRRRANRFLTYDTGWMEALYVELPEGFDWKGEALDIASWHSAAYLRGGMRLSFLSTSASGRIVLTRHQRRRFLRAPIAVYAGTARMTFDRPRIDTKKLGRIEIDWPVEIPAPAAQPPASG